MTALLLDPHGDDSVLFACWRLAEHRPHVVVLFKAMVQDKPAYPGGPISAATREAETSAAMSLLGCTWEQWDVYKDTETDSEDLRDALTHDLVFVSEDRCPDVVFAPAIEEGGHHQHTIVGELARDVFGDRVQPYLTYTRQGGRSKGRAVEYEPEWVALKYRALACYESQIRCPLTRPWFIDEPIREYQP